MRRHYIWLTCSALVVLTALPGLSAQSLLRAFAPAGGDGTKVILQIDWDQVRQSAPEVEMAMILRRPGGVPVSRDTVTFLSPSTNRFDDSGLDPAQTYHYFAYFKDADSVTVRFGTYPAIAHLGPIHTRPDH